MIVANIIIVVAKHRHYYTCNRVDEHLLQCFASVFINRSQSICAVKAVLA